MNLPECSLVMLAGPDDADTVRLLFNHAARTANFEFASRALTLDTLPSKKHPSGSLKTKKLLAIANEMMACGEIDSIHRTCQDSRDVENKHFGHNLHRARDFRGIPLTGWALGIERSPTDFVCHFDSDILIHTGRDYSWVARAIKHITDDPLLLFVSPHGGPPKGAAEKVFSKTFSSRRFVVDRRKLALILPTPPVHRSWKRQALMMLGWDSSYWPWETHIQKAVAQSRFYNEWLDGSGAWFLHSPEHSKEWREMLPRLVSLIEAGIYPRGQLSEELEIEEWQNL